MTHISDVLFLNQPFCPAACTRKVEMKYIGWEKVMRAAEKLNRVSPFLLVYIPHYWKNRRVFPLSGQTIVHLKKEVGLEECEVRRYNTYISQHKEDWQRHKENTFALRDPEMEAHLGSSLHLIKEAPSLRVMVCGRRLVGGGTSKQVTRAIDWLTGELWAHSVSSYVEDVQDSLNRQHRAKDIPGIAPMPIGIYLQKKRERNESELRRCLGFFTPLRDGDLSDVIATLTNREKMDITEGILRILASFDRKKVQHGDICNTNILYIRDSQRIKIELFDFCSTQVRDHWDRQFMARVLVHLLVPLQARKTEQNSLQMSSLIAGIAEGVSIQELLQKFAEISDYGRQVLSFETSDQGLLNWIKDPDDSEGSK